MKLVSILNESLIFTNVKGVSRAGIYTDMLKRAQDILPMTLDVDRVVSGMIEREDTLKLPYEGMALPHLRLPEFDDLYILVGILPQPVQMQSVDTAQSRLVVMSLISPDTSDLYLKSLAAMIRFVAGTGNLDKLAGAGNSEEFLTVLRDANVKIRSSLTAEDLARSNGPVVRADDTLAKALDLFTCGDIDCVPVVDNAGCLVGELKADEVLRRFIPEYIFRMENLDFLNSFEPFNRIFKEESEQIVRDYMCPVSLVVKPETPLIQFTVKMIKDDVDSCFITDADGKYLGEIIINDIIKKVLRG